MSELEDLDQELDLARLGLSSMPDAKARVRDRLAVRGAFSPAGPLANPKLAALPRPRPRHGVPTLVSAALMGVSFAAGYWLRDVQTFEPRGAQPGLVEPARSPPPVPLPPVPSPPAPAEPSASPAAESPAAESPLGSAPVRSSPLAPVASDASMRVEPARSVASRKPLDEPSATGPRRGPRHPAPASSSRTAPTSGELALLRRAERAIRSGDPALALILLDQLERSYPASTLGEERTAARLLVDCARSGDLAKPDAARFLEKHPSSVYSDRIVRSCRLEASRAAESSTDVDSNGH